MTRVEGSTATVRFDFEDPGFVADRYPAYRRLRHETPIARDERGFWIFSAYEDCDAMLRDPRWSSDTRHATAEAVLEEHPGLGGASLPYRPSLFYDPPSFTAVRPLIFVDPPEHHRLRRAFARAFTPKAVQSQRERCAALLAEVLENDTGEELDVVASVAYPMPLTIICELLGVPLADRDLFLKCSGPLAAVINPGFSRTAGEREETVRSLMELSGYLWGLVEERRSAPGDDLVSALLSKHDDGALDDQEIVASCLLLLVAGHETTASLIGTALLALARHPEQWRALRDDRSLLGPGIEEFVRYDSPVQIVARTALEDMTVRGLRIRAGEHVIALLGSANHDEAVFENPERLELARPNASRHLGFGFGIHHCLGAPLARVELEAFLSAVLDRFAGVEVVGNPRYRQDVVLRGLAELRVRFLP